MGEWSRATPGVDWKDAREVLRQGSHVKRVNTYILHVARAFVSHLLENGDDKTYVASQSCITNSMDSSGHK